MVPLAMAADDRTMFEIYRGTDYDRAFRAIFYTELDEHARDDEIARAANGETLFTGYLDDRHKARGRELVDAIVDELNEMEEDDAGMPTAEIERRLAEVLAPPP